MWLQGFTPVPSVAMSCSAAEASMSIPLPGQLSQRRSMQTVSADDQNLKLLSRWLLFLYVYCVKDPDLLEFHRNFWSDWDYFLGKFWSGQAGQALISWCLRDLGMNLLETDDPIFTPPA